MAQAAPIMIWQPGGGTAGGGPISNPPVYSQAGTTALVEDQAYVDVVFGSIQTNDTWVLVACEVENTTDFEPLNIWPGIITDRTAAGFRLQLNGLPDSENYYLHWAVSGINITPSAASTYFLTGPSSGGFAVASTFSVALPPSTTVPGTVTVTPDDGGAGGVFSPTSVTLTTSVRSATFTYTPASYGAITISADSDGALLDPASVAFTCVASTYTLIGPSSGSTGVASTNFTVALPVGGVVTGTVTVTPHDSSDGSFTPTTVALTTASPSHTFTYTPASSGTKTVSTTNDGGLTNPTGVSYLVTAPFAPSDIAGLKLWLKADAIAGPPADGDLVATWADSSGSGNDVTATGTARPTYKTAIVNGKPVVRFNGLANIMDSHTFTGLPTNSTQHTFFVVANASSVSADSRCMFSAMASVASVNIIFRRDTVALNHFHFDGGYPVASEASAIVLFAWNVFTGDWNGSNIHLWRNGTLKDTTGVTLMPNFGTWIAVGAQADGSQFWPGDIAEVIFYNSALSVPDRQAVELYLKTKYNTP